MIVKVPDFSSGVEQRGWRFFSNFSQVVVSQKLKSSVKDIWKHNNSDTTYYFINSNQSEDSKITYRIITCSDDRNERRVVIICDCHLYLMNDEGKTIERVDCY